MLYTGNTSNVSTTLPKGTYLVKANSKGYVPYSEKIKFDGDPIDVNMSTINEGAKFTLNDINFATGKSTILPASYAALDSLANFMKQNPEVKVDDIG